MISSGFPPTDYRDCRLCPRRCGVDRLAGETGVCGAGADIRLGRAALHWWEEPCLVGQQGSGAVFFSHCPLRCVYCQNAELAAGCGVVVSCERLGDIFLELQDVHHAANINLVTATQYLPSLVEVLRSLRPAKLHIPVIYNTSGYETPEALALLDGLIDIYLVDYKYAFSETAKRLSSAPDYPEVALRAIGMMADQVGDFTIDDATGLLKKGVIVRHLLLPGYEDESPRALELLRSSFGSRVKMSIMNQFVMPATLGDPTRYGLTQGVTDGAYEEILDYADSLGIRDYFWQVGGAQDESFIPAFDGTGVIAVAPSEEECGI